MARNKYPEVTEERILDVAQRLFLEKGYENTTIQDIVNELGGRIILNLTLEDRDLVVTRGELSHTYSFQIGLE